MSLSAIERQTGNFDLSSATKVASHTSERHSEVPNLSEAEQQQLADRSALANLLQARHGQIFLADKQKPRQILFSDEVVNDFKKASADFRQAKDDGAINLPIARLSIVKKRVIDKLRVLLTDDETRKTIEDISSPETVMLRGILELDEKFSEWTGYKDLALDFVSPSPRFFRSDDQARWGYSRAFKAKLRSSAEKSRFVQQAMSAVIPSETVYRDPEPEPEPEIKSNPEDVLLKDFTKFDQAVWTTAFVTKDKDNSLNPLLAFPDIESHENNLFLKSVCKLVNQPLPARKSEQKGLSRTIERDINVALGRIQDMLLAAEDRPNLMPEKMKECYERLVKYNLIYTDASKTDLASVLARKMEWGQFVKKQRSKL